MHDVTWIVIVDRGAVFAQKATIAFETFAGQSPDNALVVDIYDAGNPVHPAGHIGWWKFVPDSLPASAAVTLERTDTGIRVSIGEHLPVDSWINPAPPRTSQLILHLVLRSNATNALLAADRIPVMDTPSELATLHAAFDRDWSKPGFAVSPYVLNADTTVHLVAPSIHQRDGVGNLCLDLFRLLHQNDIPVRLYADDADLQISDIVEPQVLLSRRVGKQDHTLYFCSTSDPRLADIAKLPGRKSAYYHGITDPAKLRVFDPELAVNAARGLADLPLLGGFDGLAANSRRSAGQLARVLGRDPDTIRVIAPKLLIPPAPARLTRSRAPDLLTVCQLNPHKKLEDVLRLFAAYRVLEPAARCHIVGQPRGRAYRDFLAWVEHTELGLPQGTVVWHGSIGDAELADAYRSAAALVSMSEDEGFCLPLFEAMSHDTPVLAYGISAVRETLGDSGLAFATKDPTHLAQVLFNLLHDADRRERLLRQQRLRYAELAGLMTGREFFDLLQPAWPLPDTTVQP